MKAWTSVSRRLRYNALSYTDSGKDSRICIVLFADEKMIVLYFLSSYNNENNPSLGILS